jgi:hypothetical protein
MNARWSERIVGAGQFLGALGLALVLAGHGQAEAPDPLALADALSEKGDLVAARALLEKSLAEAPTLGAWRRLGGVALRQGDARRAADAYEHVLASPESAGDWRSRYNAACAQARLGALDDAWRWLEAAVDSGSLGPALLEADDDLAPLRGSPRWAALRERAARAVEPCRFRPESSQFDFWLGEWRVRPRAGGSVAGHSRIEKILSDCVVLEHWSGANGWSGKSFNLFDRASGRWRQTWVDQSGTITDFVDGQAGPGLMSFRTRPVTRDGVSSETRLTFSALDADHVRQHAQVSTDGGRTWRDQYDFVYERVR